MERVSGIHARLLSFLAKNGKRAGAKVIAALLARPGVKVDVMELCRRIHYPQASPEYVDKLSRHAFTSIPFADKRAVAEYLERLRFLRQRVSDRQPSPGEEWEIQWLERELRRVCRPRIGVKAESPELRKAYSALRMGVNRLLLKAQASDPELHSYMRLHLKTGYSFMWTRDIVSIADMHSQTMTCLDNVA